MQCGILYGLFIFSRICIPFGCVRSYFFILKKIAVMIVKKVITDKKHDESWNYMAIFGQLFSVSDLYIVLSSLLSCGD